MHCGQHVNLKLMTSFQLPSSPTRCHWNFLRKQFAIAAWDEKHFLLASSQILRLLLWHVERIPDWWTVIIVKWRAFNEIIFSCHRVGDLISFQETLKVRSDNFIERFTIPRMTRHLTRAFQSLLTDHNRKGSITNLDEQWKEFNVFPEVFSIDLPPAARAAPRRVDSNDAGRKTFNNLIIKLLAEAIKSKFVASHGHKRKTFSPSPAERWKIFSVR